MNLPGTISLLLFICCLPPAASWKRSCLRECECIYIDHLVDRVRAKCTEKVFSPITDVPAWRDARLLTDVSVHGSNIPDNVLTKKYFEVLPELLTLEITKTNLVSVSQNAFQNNHFLEIIKFTYNNLALMDKPIFEGMTLKALHLDGNPRLTLTPVTFRGLEVKTLSMTDCQLKFVDFEVLGHLVLADSRIRLADNHLTTIPKSFSRVAKGNFNPAVKIDIYNNRLACSKENCWIRDDLTFNRDKDGKSVQKLFQQECEEFCIL